MNKSKKKEAFSMFWIIVVLIYLTVDVYAYQAVKQYFVDAPNLLMYAYIGLSLLLLAFLAYYAFTFQKQDLHESPRRLIILGVFFTFFVTKLLISIGMLTEDVFRIGQGVCNKLSNSQSQKAFLPSRRKFVASIVLGIAALPFSTLIYGIIRGKYNFKVLKYEITFDNLPEAFDGFTLTQISDLHVGSWDSEKEFTYAMDLVNQQESDAILVTGDLVNDIAEEAEKWQNQLSSLKAKDGVYSVLGNHDYGDYYRWETKEDKAANLQKLKELQAEMGWTLLNNENISLERNQQKLHILGVENWGSGSFKKAGDIQKTNQGLDASDFKILMSHDPSHWEEQVRDNDELAVDLTLSGHTHGMQYGIEIPGFVRWSPVQFRYKYWAGLYKEGKRFLHVNRGLGFLGYPGRFGIWPEITVIRLRKK